MEWQGVEIELQVPCAKGKKHPVRLRFTGWGEYEVIYNPCVELLGEALARMAPCSHYLQERKWWTGDSSLRKRVVDALSQAGSPAVPALIQALGDNWEGVRSAACGALGAIGDPHAVPALSVWAAAGEQAAQDALQSLGQPPMELQEAITHLLHAGDWGVVQRALWHNAVCEAVAQVGAPAVPALIQALGDNWAVVRSAACAALGVIGDPHAVPALIQALGDDWGSVRSAACAALGVIGDPHAVPALEKVAAQDSDGGVRGAARQAIREIQEKNRQ